MSFGGGKKKDDEPVTKGGQVFDQVTYNGIGYWVNLGSSVAIADYLLDGPGRKYLDKAAEGVDKHMLSKVMGEAASKQMAFNSVKTMSLLMGGTALMWPILQLENNKRKIVHKLDRKMGTSVDGLSPAADIDLDATPQEELPPVANEPPKQTLSQAAVRRAIAIASVVVGSNIVDKLVGNKRIEEAGVNAILGTMEKSGNQTLQKIAGVPIVRRYTKLTVLDSLFTAISAAAIYATVPPEPEGKSVASKPSGGMPTPSEPADSKIPMADPMKDESAKDSAISDLPQTKILVQSAKRPDGSLLKPTPSDASYAAKLDQPENGSEYGLNL